MYTKQTLASLGKQASNMFIEQGVPLNDAIIKIASTRPDMTKEHVQRVIENANLITFEDMFKSSSDKHVTFSLAEPEVIHEELDRTEDIADPVYSTEPTYARLGGFDYVEKEASYSGVPDHVRWRREYYATKGAMEQLEKTASTLDASAEAKTHNFVRLCKQAALSSEGLCPVLQLAGYASQDEDIFTKVAGAVVASLQDIVPIGEYVDTLPNKTHPIYRAYESLEETIKEASLHRKGLINAARMHEQVKSEEFIQ